MSRKQYLEVLSKDEAQRAWAEALDVRPLGDEEVPLAAALGRLLAVPFAAPGDLPPFDRAVVDGYALVAQDTFAATAERPARLRLLGAVLAAGDDPAGHEVGAGVALEIATGASIPAGADAVVMIEHTEREGDVLVLREPLVPGQGIQRRGTDVEDGEVLFPAGRRLTARETCVIAGLGTGRVLVRRRPRVAVISTGDELVAPGGGALRPGQIYDANARLVADLVHELGGEPVELGIARDDEAALRGLFERARACDAVVLSGGTSKGSGDLTYRMVEALGRVVVHGVSIKPGKPLVLAVWEGKPVAILPGFPTSAAVTFEVFVRPVLAQLAGVPSEAAHARSSARVGVAMPSAAGRHEYVLCYLAADGDGPPRAFPLLKGSGATSGLARADGWVEVPADREHVPAGALLPLSWLRGPTERAAADLVLVGEPSPALEPLFQRLAREGLRVRFLPGSPVAALDAVAKDLADGAVIGRAGQVEAEAQGLVALPVARRRFGLVARPGAPLEGQATPAMVAALQSGARLARARKGSDARMLDEVVREGVAPVGPPLELGSARAVARAVAAGRADLAITTEDDARENGLAFLLAAELPLLLVVAPVARRAPQEALARAARDLGPA